MLKKHVKYTDFDGLEIEEDLYFNFTKTELTEWELSEKGGLANKLKQIVDSKDIPAMASTFKEIVLKAYGQKSADGKRFVKSEELSKEFEQTLAYDVLMQELLQNDGAAANFINAVIPQDIQGKPSAIPASVK